MGRKFRRSRRIVFTLCGCIALASAATAQQTLTGSETYRAEKCAGQYTCDEDGASTVVWGPSGSAESTSSSKPASEPPAVLPRVHLDTPQPVATSAEKPATAMSSK
jgi:hypothetical protein